MHAMLTNSKVIIVFGEMASGKSTVAKALAYQHFHLEKDAFFEGDDVLNSQELANLKEKVKINEPLTMQDVERLIDKLIAEIKARSKNHSLLIVSQALYFDRHRKQLQDAFGKDNISFIWVKTPFFTHMYRLFSRELSTYMHDKEATPTNYFYAIWNGIKSIRTYFVYNPYFELPFGFFKNYSSINNSKNKIKAVDGVSSIVINNNGTTRDLIRSFSSLDLLGQNKTSTSMTNLYKSLPFQLVDISSEQFGNEKSKVIPENNPTGIKGESNTAENLDHAPQPRLF